MKVEYINPLKISFEKMKQILFKPMIAKNWFILGFSAWLANLLDNFVSFRIDRRFNINTYDLPFKSISSFKELIEQTLQFLNQHFYLVYIIIIVLIFSIALAIVMLWLSSRGKFIFLYNVIEKKIEIKKPWETFRYLGNSLFLWRLIFGIITFIFFIGLFIPYIYIILKVFPISAFSIKFLPVFIMLTFLIVLLAITIFLISLYLNDFIIPIMYINNINVNNAWKKFLNIFSKQSACFILYAIYILGLSILVGISLIIFIVCTCCIGLILLIIPYINAVILLPITYTHRWLSVIFLSQFVNELNERISQN